MITIREVIHTNIYEEINTSHGETLSFYLGQFSTFTHKLLTIPRDHSDIPKKKTHSYTRTCKIGSNTLIGAHTEIGDNVTLQASVIGQHCIIGPNVALRNAYIFDGTHIGANSTIEDSIIGADVRVGERSKIESGCLVGDGVILGNSARLGKFERISKRREITEEVDDEENENEIEEDEDSELEEVEARKWCFGLVPDAKRG